MRNLIEQMIKEAEHKLEQPNAKVDNYRAYWEGRISLAEQLLELPQTPVMLSLPSEEDVFQWAVKKSESFEHNLLARQCFIEGAEYMRKCVERGNEA